LGQAGNWDIDLIAQRIGAYDLNHSFEAQLAAAGHDMEMSDMNMEQMHDTSGSNLGTLENEQTVPPFDSFAMLTLVLAGTLNELNFYQLGYLSRKHTANVTKITKKLKRWKYPIYYSDEHGSDAHPKLDEIVMNLLIEEGVPSRLSRKVKHLRCLIFMFMRISASNPLRFSS
jgi:hypothetical protein